MTINGDFGQKEMKTVEGVVCVLIKINYMIDGCFGAHSRGLKEFRFALDTEDDSNLIRRNSLPIGWENNLDPTTSEPRLNDANGNALNIIEVVWLTKRFGTTPYKVEYILVERLEVGEIIVTSFMNGHFKRILC